ncbi:MAG: galactose mutarotase [Lachnospiraceae bacterium]|nr:galactose mutarotase [Lachnospiraceae bacterium]
MDTFRNFGKTSDGRTARLYEIRKGRLSACITDFGAALVSFAIDRGNSADNVVAGYESAAEYEEKDGCLGAIVGRSANRIGPAPAQFEGPARPGFVLNGRRCLLNANESGRTNLHSGPDYYFRRYWSSEGPAPEGDSISFTLFSPDGDQGFPGNMKTRVTYSLSEEEGLRIDYEAVSDADTVCNFTNHAYFDLGCGSNCGVHEHEIQIFADRITVKDEYYVPTGEFLPVEGTDFDLRENKMISRDYDDNFVLADHKRVSPELAARLACPISGLALYVYTDLPGLQLYTTSGLSASGGRTCGIALETQYFPNAVNIPGFPQPVIRAGEVWRSSTIYRLCEE